MIRHIFLAWFSGASVGWGE